MTREALRFRPAGLGAWVSGHREMRVDSDGLVYRDRANVVDVRWAEVQALVPAAVQPDPDDAVPEVPALGIVLWRPFDVPVLVDGPFPDLDYAIPLEDLSQNRWFRGLSTPANDIVDAIVGYAREAGVTVAALIPTSCS